jgi:CheY-like chemotaxis protein
VLVVEDNPVNQLYLTELLKLMGCSCHVAGDGKAAIQAADNIAFDLVLLDCQIPEMDGFSVAYHIRQRHGSSGTPPSVPIVGVTATCDEPSRRRAVLSGMTEIVAKPIEGEELRALLMKYLPLASETPADA